MSIVIALNDLGQDHIRPLSASRKNEKKTGRHIAFFESTADKPDEPTAFLVEYDPGGSSSQHFHEVDQFQIVVGGKGTFGRHDVSPYCVHFARAYTPYGPLHSETGWSFLTLRTRYDSGSQRNFDTLKQMPDRRPWQMSKKIDLQAAGPGISLKEVPEIKDEQGLFTCSLSMAPHAETRAPDPSGGDGQYVVVVKGSLLHENKEHKALTIVFVKPEENAFRLQAGPQGLEALILNFPRLKLRPAQTRMSSPAGFKQWQCVLCAFAYDEALGLPQEGITAGTRWADVPEGWSCPDCAANKSDFQMIEV